MEKKSLFLTIFIYLLVIILMRLINFNTKVSNLDFITLGFFTEVEERSANTIIKEDIPKIEIPAYGDVPIKVEEEKKFDFEEKSKSFVEEKTGFDEEKFFSISGEISTRKLVKFKKPDFPQEEKEPSVVRLEITVNEEGDVIKIEVIKTGGYNFDKSAIDAVREWKFMPIKNLKEQKGIVKINFKIR